MIYEKSSWGSNVHGGKVDVRMVQYRTRERKISWGDVGGVNRWKCHDSERFVMYGRVCCHAVLFFVGCLYIQGYLGLVLVQKSRGVRRGT